MATPKATSPSRPRPHRGRQVHVSSVLAYARSLDVWGLSGKFAVLLPVAKVSGSAKVAGDERERIVSGLGDPLRLSVNFYGAPAVSMDQYPTYGRTSSSAPACR